MNPYFRDTSDEFFLDKKTFLIIGGSDVDLSWAQTKSDDVDVVIRINQHWLRQRGRCDALYHTVRGPNLDFHCLMRDAEFRPQCLMLNLVDSEFSAGITREPQYANMARFARMYRAKVGYFAQGEWGKENPWGPNYEWLPALHRRFDCKLFTGLVALAHVLRFNPVKVYVAGMTLYAEEEHDVADWRDSHKLLGNYLFLSEAIRHNCVEVSDVVSTSLDRCAQRWWGTTQLRPKA